MTLNITVVTSRCIYQSADYRLYDLQTKAMTDFQTQKIFVVNTYKWTATICFTGVGRTDGVKTHEWLSEKLGLIQQSDPYERLIDELRKADSWLSRVPAPNNKHSFSVGAFVGTKPVFTLISNFERPSGHKLTRATSQLSVFNVPINKPKVIVPGQARAVTRLERKRIRALAAKDPPADLMHSLLAEVNRSAGARMSNISPACCTTHLRLTGEGETRLHDTGDALLPDPIAMSSETRKIIQEVVDDQFGPGKGRIKSTSFMRADASDEYHKAQLHEKPDDPSVHSNYGAYLKEKKGDIEAAEREYRIALELDRKHVNALGNLANLVWENGERAKATCLYRKALGLDPGNEIVSWNFARFLAGELDDRVAANEVLDSGILVNPESGRLFMLQAEFSLADGASLEALESFRQARQKGADQARVEYGYAFALHMSNAPVRECIAAYQVALALNPNKSEIFLNLSQLLFLMDDHAEAKKKLDEAERLGLDKNAKLEAQFYRLCHTHPNLKEVFRSAKSLLAQGALLRWNVQPNIDFVKNKEPHKAGLLDQILRVMAGEEDQTQLDVIITKWPCKSSE